MTRVITTGRFSAGSMLGIGAAEIAHGVNAGFILIGGGAALVVLIWRYDDECK